MVTPRCDCPDMVAQTRCALAVRPGAVSPSPWRQPNQQAVVRKRTLQPRDVWVRLLLLGEPDSRDIIARGRCHTPSPYGLGEGQCFEGSNGNVHLEGTRGKGGGMLRQEEDVEAETRTVFVLSGTNSWKAKTLRISDLVTAGVGVGQALKC